MLVHGIWQDLNLCFQDMVIYIWLPNEFELRAVFFLYTEQNSAHPF